MALADWTLSGATQEELLCSFGLVMRSELVYSFAAQSLCLALVSLDLSFGRAVSDEPSADNELGKKLCFAEQRYKILCRSLVSYLCIGRQLLLTTRFAFWLAEYLQQLPGGALPDPLMGRKVSGDRCKLCQTFNTFAAQCLCLALVSLDLSFGEQYLTNFLQTMSLVRNFVSQSKGTRVFVVSWCLWI